MLARALEKLDRTALLTRKSIIHRWTNRFGASEEKKVLFVTGTHRSGTNMIMDALERHSATDVYHETDPRVFHRYVHRGRSVLRDAIDRSPSRRVVIKALHESEQTLDLVTEFAPARVLWMYRDWRDVVNSLVSRWPQNRNRIDEIVEGTCGDNWRCQGISEQTLAIVRDVYTPNLSIAAVNTLFWYIRNQIFFDLALDNDARCLLLRFEDIVENPEQHIRALCAHFDMPYEAAMARVPSGTKIRKKPAPDIPSEIAALADNMLTKLATVAPQCERVEHGGTLV